MGSKRFSILFDSQVDTSTAEKNIKDIQKLFEKTKLEVTPQYNDSVFKQIQKNLKESVSDATKLKSIVSSFKANGNTYAITQQQAISASGSKYWQSPQVTNVTSEATSLQNQLKGTYTDLISLQTKLNSAIKAGKEEQEQLIRGYIDTAQTQAQKLENTLSVLGQNGTNATLEKLKRNLQLIKSEEGLAVKAKEAKQLQAETRASSNALSSYLQHLQRQTATKQRLIKVESQMEQASAKGRKALEEEADQLREIINFEQQYMDAAQKSITSKEHLEQATYEQKKAEQNLNAELKRSESNLKNQKTLLEQLGSAIKQNITNMLTVGLANGIFNLIQQGAQQAIVSIQELDKAMTDIQMVTNGTSESTQALFKQYNQMANELGSTTVQIAEGASEWLRQGRSLEETNELLRQSAIFAKVGALESSEATTQLTAVLNGFKMGAEDAAHVVDALSSVDLKAATSTRELSEALQYTSNSARGAGVEFEEIVGMIGSVSEATRLSSSMIGNAFKTLFARYGNIAAGKTIDDFGESINDVETVMRSLGIEIREDEDTFRSFMDVISEVASKWDTLADTQKNQIATAMGGTRQREILMALLENWDRATDLMDVATNSAGASAEKFDIYLESIEAKTNELKATFEGLVKSEGATNLFKMLIDLGTQLIKILDDIVNGSAGKAILGGALVGALMKVISVLKEGSIAIKGIRLAFAGGQIALTVGETTMAFASLGAAIKAAGAALLASPFGVAVAVAAGIYAIVKAIDAATISTEEWAEKATNLRAEFQELQSQIEQNKSEISQLVHKGTLTEDEELYLSLLVQQTEELEKQAKLRKQEEYEAKSNSINAGSYDYDVYDETGQKISTVEFGEKSSNELVEYYKELQESLKTADTVEAQRKLRKELSETKSQILENALAMLEYKDAGVELRQEDKDLLESVKELGFEFENVKEKILTDDDINQTNEELDEVNKQLESITTELHNIQDAATMIGTVEGEIANSGQISLDTLDQITERWPQLTDLVNQYLLGLSSQEEVLAALQNAYAIDEENAYNNVVAKLKMNEDYFNLLKTMDADLVRQFNEDYGLDLDNHVGYAQGKEEIEKTLLNEFNRIWAEHFGKTLEGFGDIQTALDAMAQHDNSAYWSEHRPKGWADLQNIADKYKKAMADWEDVYDNSFVIQLTNQYKDLGTAARDSARAAQGASDAAAKAAEKARKQQEDYYNKLVELTVKMLKKEKELEKERLKDQLEGYKKLIDAQQKLLDKKDEEYKRDRELEDRNKAISQLEAQIAELQFDTSAEGIKKRLELEAELAEGKRDLEDYQHDYSIDQQKDALDEEEDRYEDHINSQIKEIDRWLSETGKIYAEARRLIDEHADSTLQKLLEYNDIYGIILAPFVQ